MTCMLSRPFRGVLVLFFLLWLGTPQASALAFRSETDGIVDALSKQAFHDESAHEAAADFESDAAQQCLFDEVRERLKLPLAGLERRPPLSASSDPADFPERGQLARWREDSGDVLIARDAAPAADLRAAVAGEYARYLDISGRGVDDPGVLDDDAGKVRIWYRDEHPSELPTCAPPPPAKKRHGHAAKSKFTALPRTRDAGLRGITSSPASSGPTAPSSPPSAAAARSGAGARTSAKHPQAARTHASAAVPPAPRRKSKDQSAPRRPTSPLPRKVAPARTRVAAKRPSAREKHDNPPSAATTHDRTRESTPPQDTAAMRTPDHRDVAPALNRENPAPAQPRPTPEISLPHLPSLPAIPLYAKASAARGRRRPAPRRKPRGASVLRRRAVALRPPRLLPRKLREPLNPSSPTTSSKRLPRAARAVAARLVAMKRAAASRHARRRPAPRRAPARRVAARRDNFARMREKNNGARQKSKEPGNRKPHHRRRPTGEKDKRMAASPKTKKHAVASAA